MYTRDYTGRTVLEPPQLVLIRLPGMAKCGECGGDAVARIDVSQFGSGWSAGSDHLHARNCSEISCEHGQLHGDECQACYAAEAAERAAREAEEARVRAEREALEAERKALAEQRAELERAQAELKAAKEKAEREEFERQTKRRLEREAAEKAECDRIAAEEARVAEAERQAELARRLEALKPDAEKLHAYGLQLGDVPPPEVSSPEAKARLREALASVRVAIRGLCDFGKPTAEEEETAAE